MDLRRACPVTAAALQAAGAEHGLRVDGVKAPRFEVLQLELYAPGLGERALLLAWRGPKRTAVLGRPLPGRGEAPPAFVLGMRRRLEGARLDAALWHPGARLFACSFRRGDELTRLGLYPNGILLADGDGGELQAAGSLPAEPWPDTGWDNTPGDDPPGGGDAYAAFVAALFAEERDGLARALAKAAKRRAGILHKLDDEEAGCRGYEETRRRAELLKGQLWKIKRGATDVVLDDYLAPDAGATVSVPVDPRLAPAENLARLFARARKAERSLPGIARRRAEVQAEGDAIAACLARVAAAGDETALAEARAAAAPWLPAPRPAAAAREHRPPAKGELAAPYRTIDKGEVVLWAGRNARGNEYVTFRLAAGNDIWLHCRDYPGSHVVLHRKRKDYVFTPEDIRDAALVALHFSGAGKSSREEVLWAQAKHVKKASGGAPGRVVVAGGKSVLVDLTEEALARALSPSPRST